MTNRVITFLSIILVALVGATELATYHFGQDLGQTFPDRANNGYDGTNGSDHITDQSDIL